MFCVGDEGMKLTSRSDAPLEQLQPVKQMEVTANGLRVCTSVPVWGSCTSVHP